MISKKILVYILIAVQALLLLFVIKTGIWRLNHFPPHHFGSINIRSVWTRWKNDSEAVEPEAEVFGLIDLNDQQYGWLNEPAKNVTRSIVRSTAVPTTTSMSTVETTLTNSLGSKILRPVVKHNKGELFLLVLVTTVPGSLVRRELVRNTWANHRINQTGLNSNNFSNITSCVVFIVGITGDVEQDNAIEQEANKYGDIIRAPCTESYRNIIVKLWFAFEWALQYQPNYILKVDDDIYVRIPRFATWLSEGKVPNRLYGGYVHYRAYISRNPKNKHYVSKSEYKGQFFPNYCAGPCYTFSGDLLEEFLELSKSVPMFKVEDAYLGLIAKRNGVKPYDMGGKLFVWDRSLSKTVRKWNDERLRKVICLGDSLTLEAIKYIHKRFIDIDNS